MLDIVDKNAEEILVGQALALYIQVEQGMVADLAVADGDELPEVSDLVPSDVGTSVA